MAVSYQISSQNLNRSPKRWLVTGAAGFIGSNICQRLIELQQTVVGLDNFATGHRRNIEDFHKTSNFSFVECDINEPTKYEKILRNTDIILHQAALGSVPRSLEKPLNSHHANTNGFIQLLDAARLAGVSRFVFASSSSVYGDDANLPKKEDVTGQVLSPYAATKKIDEIYAGTYARAYKMTTVGLRYFNVFGPRQDPNGPYAAVIPRWIKAFLQDQTVEIFGDGKTSRDFSHVENVIQGNILAGSSELKPTNYVFNISCGQTTSLTDLFHLLRNSVIPFKTPIQTDPVYRDFRTGDIRHSHADINKAQTLLGYTPAVFLQEGLKLAMPWYVAHL